MITLTSYKLQIEISTLQRRNIFEYIMETEGFFPIWNHHNINVLVGSFRFIWIPMLWLYGHYKWSNSFSFIIDIRLIMNA